MKTRKAKAKEVQGYLKSGPTCEGCQHFTCRRVEVEVKWAALPRWREVDLRCKLGGFAVAKRGWCRMYEDRKPGRV